MHFSIAEGTNNLQIEQLLTSQAHSSSNIILLISCNCTPKTRWVNNERSKGAEGTPQISYTKHAYVSRRKDCVVSF